MGCCCGKTEAEPSTRDERSGCCCCCATKKYTKSGTATRRRCCRCRRKQDHEKPSCCCSKNCSRRKARVPLGWEARPYCHRCLCCCYCCCCFHVKMERKPQQPQSYLLDDDETSFWEPMPMPDGNWYSQTEIPVNSSPQIAEKGVQYSAMALSVKPVERNFLDKSAGMSEAALEVAPCPTPVSSAVGDVVQWDLLVNVEESMRTDDTTSTTGCCDEAVPVTTKEMPSRRSIIRRKPEPLEKPKKNKRKKPKRWY